MKDSLAILTKSAEETKKLGEKLAKEILSDKISKKALVISLEGDLGAGKTTFTQGFARGLGIKENPRSPTFVIMRAYAIRHKPYALRHKAYGLRQFIHIDAYRIALKDMKMLGWDKFLKNPENIILIEWGNIFKKAMPKKTIRIIFKHTGYSRHRLIKIMK
ncbi:MAG: tRNA (adenosine(37)-N6)-threonylcarbamoyltransferase complex ATPase subunit type 1 TsaE [bacterium]|nr:tRNA (adenosine(37)-N6)-threonylcarbamoyltransferase complex ATPase subunit type 1 TsaE [bacterium]